MAAHEICHVPVAQGRVLRVIPAHATSVNKTSHTQCTLALHAGALLWWRSRVAFAEPRPCEFEHIMIMCRGDMHRTTI